MQSLAGSAQGQLVAGRHDKNTGICAQFSERTLEILDDRSSDIVAPELFARGISQELLPVDSEVDRTYINELENKRRNP